MPRGKGRKTKKLHQYYGTRAADMEKVVCSHCGCETDNYCIIERGQKGENWIEDIWVNLGYEGKPVCAECYYK